MSCVEEKVKADWPQAQALGPVSDVMEDYTADIPFDSTYFLGSKKFVRS